MKLAIFALCALLSLTLPTGAQAANEPACGIMMLTGQFPDEARESLLGDFDFLQSLKGGEGDALYKKIFSANFDGSSHCEYLKNRIQLIQFGNCGPSGVACNFNGTMMVTANYAKLNPIERISILIQRPAIPMITAGPT